MTLPLFASDNTAGIHPKIMQALSSCNSNRASAYGSDAYTNELKSVFSDLFERETFVFPVPTGTAANGLALAAITPAHGTIFCHKKAHIVTTECGAPEFYSGGARLTQLEGYGNKIDAASVSKSLEELADGSVHHLVPSALSITQATECGVAYSIEEIQNLSEVTRGAGMKVHMDGARFANALVALNSSPAELSWKSGIDVLSFGTTKNGTINAEAVVVFDQELSREIGYRHKRAGLLYSKMRFMSAQLLAYLENDLWLANAAKSNGYARRLRRALSVVPGVEFPHTTDINAVFAFLPDALPGIFAGDGIQLRSWPDERGSLYRLVTSFDDVEDQVELFEESCIKAAKALSGKTLESGKAEELN